MRQIIIPAYTASDIPFFLAVEEWVARNLPADEYFFAWQVAPSIICGRHQDIFSEVDLQAAADAGVEVWRRKSGGGAVLADRNNVMFSYITPSVAVETSFSRYTSMICRFLADIGIQATPTGRNDIAIGGRKVAGNAFLKLPGRSIVHGTMLYDADFALMERLLTPSRAKKISKGVVSVPSRVTTLRREGISISISDFISRALSFMCPDPSTAITLSPNHLEEVMKIRATYLDGVEKGYGPSHSSRQECPTTERSAYIEGAGWFRCRFSTDASGVISNFSLDGDFFPLTEISDLCARLEGVPLCRDKILEKLPVTEETIAGLSRQALASLITDN